MFYIRFARLLMVLIVTSCGYDGGKKSGSSSGTPTGASPDSPSFSISMANTDVNLGSVSIGSQTSIYTLTVNNTGTISGYCYGPYKTGSESWEYTIVQDNCTYRTIPGASSCTVKVRGIPNGKGLRFMQLELSCYDSSYSYSSNISLFTNFTMTGI